MSGFLFSMWRRLGWRPWPLLALLVLATRVPVTFAAPAVPAPMDQGPALEYRHFVRNYGPEDGFQQHTINALLQARDGYLWIGTFGGLVRFDGSKFVMVRAAYGKSASPTPDGADGPSSNRILALREDARGRIWIGTEDAGLSLYDHGRFLQLPICGGVCKVYSLSRQVGQSLWAATDAGLFRIATDSLRADLIKVRSPNHYNAVAIADDGDVYVGGGNTGFGKATGNGIEPIALPPGVVATAHIMAARGYIWAITGKGLYRFDPAEKTWAREIAEPILRTLESSDGRLWIVTMEGEIRHTDLAGQWQTVSGIPVMYANVIWRDRTGALWIGSNNKGLWSLKTSMAMTLDTVQPLASYPGSGRAIASDGEGGVWLGYGCGGVHHRLRDGTYETSTTRAVKRDLCVTSLLRDADGALWIGTINEGLQRIGDDGLQTLPQSLSLSNLQIWQADDGQYWLSGEGRTFNVLRTGAGEYVLSAPVAALEGFTVRKMVMARKGGIWFVGDQGVVRLDNNRIVERWTPTEGLSSRFARSLYEDRRGVLWVGTYGGGLNRIENGRVTHYDESNGLFDDTVSCILADVSGWMWLGGNRGISVLPAAAQAGKDFETLPFAVSASQASFEMNGGMQSVCARDDSGQLWFAMVSGFARATPRRLAEMSAQQPQVHIERATSEKGRHSTRATVVLGHGVRFLQIDYTAINLVSPDELSFRYRISGTDAQWTQAGQSRSLVIHDVPWGNHVFEVQARNRGGAWSPAATLRISRPVPWYRYQWLWPLSALLALLALMWRTRATALSATRDERLQRMSAEKSLAPMAAPSDRP